MPTLCIQQQEQSDRMKLLTEQVNTKSMPYLPSAGDDSKKAKGE
jgi:hypothetical protein